MLAEGRLQSQRTIETAFAEDVGADRGEFGRMFEGLHLLFEELLALVDPVEETLQTLLVVGRRRESSARRRTGLEGSEETACLLVAVLVATSVDLREFEVTLEDLGPVEVGVGQKSAEGLLDDGKVDGSDRVVGVVEEGRAIIHAAIDGTGEVAITVGHHEGFDDG